MTTPFQPLPCPGGGGESDPGLDVEGTLVCDVNGAGEVVGTALVEAVYDAETGARTGTRLVNVLDGTLYVPVGVVQPCRDGCCPEPQILCDVQPDGSAVQFVRAFTGDESGNLESADYALDGVTPYAPTGTVGSCDPFRLCTPSSDQDLNATCGPGESVEQQILLDDASAPLANSVFNDDASADPLCGGTWDRPADELNAPFPVNESFRNTTFDQPGPVLQGTAPFPDLTADVDGAGAGWLQVADINSGTNGLWQVPSPFPTSQGMNAAITFASHDGTTPGGDGMAFVFTDGGVPAQSIPVGGFGNLGLQNWQGGYVAVVLDEYGQTCTCSQAAQGVIDPNPGPCGFCGNTISIQLAGAARQGASCACCTIASISLAPKALNQTTRSTPARLLTSIIEEGGQTYVSASVDWGDGNGPVQYFQRVNVTACAGPPPATLRMAAYGGSGGAFRAIKEMRDAVARPAGVSNWRAFPITTDAIPACTQLVNVTAEVDVTFTLDDQTAGNGEPEAYLWLVNSVTNAVIDVAAVSSLPSQVGTVHHLTVSAAVPPADVPNLRVYVGAESRDDNGTYSSLWENFEVAAVGTGCPATPQRTLAISAPCPIPVAIVSGGGGDGGGGTTVVNTPSTFEDALICMTVAGETAPRPGFRREVRAPDGTITVTFLGTDGLTVTPDGWSAGACAPGDTELLEICDLGTDPATPFVRRVTYNDGGEVVTAEDVDYVGVPYVPVGPAGRCPECGPTVLGRVCVTSDAFPGVTLNAVTVQACDGTVTQINPATGVQWPGVVTVVACQPDNQFWEEILCDAGAAGAQFRRVYTLTALGSVVIYNEDLGGSPYAPVGPVELCDATQDPGRDVEQVILCDDGGPFLRVYQYGDDTGTPSGVPSDYTLAGAPYVSVGTVGACPGECGTASSIGTICYTPPIAVQTLQDDWTGATSVLGGGSRVWTNGNFAGQGITVTETVTPDTGAALLGNGVRNTATSPATQHTVIDLGAPRTNVTVRLDFFGNNQGERLRNITPAFGAVSGNGAAVLANTGVDAGPAGDGTIFLSFPGPVQTISWDYSPTGGGLSGQSFISFNTGNVSNSAPAAVLRDCTTGDTTLIDLATGTVLDPLAISIVECPTGSESDECCPILVSEVCLANGHPGAIIRNADASLTLIDTVTGLAFVAADIITCPTSAPAPVTLTAQSRVVAPGAPWTPGADVIGALTSLSATVLTGTMTVVDSNGTSAGPLPVGATVAWGAEDRHTLTGPQSITAAAASTVLVTWTQR